MSKYGVPGVMVAASVAIVLLWGIFLARSAPSPDAG